MRKARELKDGALYHVTARANRKEMILDNRGMKDLFLEVLERAKGKFRFGTPTRDRARREEGQLFKARDFWTVVLGGRLL